MTENLTFDQLPQAVTMLTKEVSELKRLLIEKQVQPPTEQAGQLITIDEVSELLHLTKPTVYSKHSKGELPGVCKRGKRLYFQRDVIINWIKEGRKKSNAEIEQEAGAYLLNTKKGLNNGK
jgi:excisionase family DNA binding protein